LSENLNRVKLRAQADEEEKVNEQKRKSSNLISYSQSTITQLKDYFRGKDDENPAVNQNKFNLG